MPSQYGAGTMLLTLEVIHGKDTSKYNVNVGRGIASIKWLALMASHRFSTEKFGATKPLVRNIFTEHQSFLHPDQTIKETLQNCQTVFVELYDELKLDKWCNPIYHPWTIIAFFQSPGKADLRQKLIEEKIQESKHSDSARIRKVEEDRVASNLPKLIRMREIMKDQLFDDAKIEAVIQKEWELIQSSGALESIVPTESEQEAIRQIFVANYAELSHFYKHYSAINSQGGTHTLEYIEFTKLVNDTEMDFFKGGMILKFFGGDISSEMNQWEFFISIINIALYKYADSRKNKGRQVALSTSTAADMTPSQAVHQLFVDHFKSHMDLLPSSIEIKDTLGTEACLLMLHDYLVSLARSFCKCSDLSFDEEALDESVNAGAMNVKQFSSFGSTFIGGIDENENVVTLKGIRQVFSTSQNDEASNETEIQLEDDNIDSHQELMVFPEFIESVARLGVLKYSADNEEEALLESMQKALDRISSD